jgi:hypothetical protein
MTALTQQEAQPLPYLLKAVLLMICATVAFVALLIAQPRQSFPDGVALASSPAPIPASDGVTEGKVSPFGPRRVH